MAEQSQNQKLKSNNKSGHVGVFYEKRRQMWRAQITVNKKVTFLGYHTNKCDAIEARRAAQKGKGFTSRHGLPD